MSAAVETAMATSSPIVGESLPVRRLRSLIASVARTRLPVLIQGPTGAGKELVAAELHALSGRRGSYVAFNVCAISESMFEDAVFGHVRGAFTGALNDSAGFLREANGGTAFLDEVSGLTAPLQAKLLRAIETGVFRPVGARNDAVSDFRTVAATNDRLDDLVVAGRFRRDLAHRLSAVVIEVPALVDRLDDMPLLVRHFLDQAEHARMVVEQDAISVLQGHSWPGNVRELRHVVEWAAALSNGHLATDAIRTAMVRRSATAAARVNRDADERQRMRDVLDQFAWNTEHAAKHLGVHRATLYRRMRKLGLEAKAREA